MFLVCTIIGIFNTMTFYNFNSSREYENNIFVVLKGSFPSCVNYSLVLPWPITLNVTKNVVNEYSSYLNVLACLWSVNIQFFLKILFYYISLVRYCSNVPQLFMRNFLSCPKVEFIPIFFNKMTGKEKYL